MSKWPVLIMSISLIFLILLLTSCTATEKDTMNEKVSGQLLTQVNLRKEQLTNPTPARLSMMKDLGMSVENLEIQRIFIHLTQKLNPAQIEEIEALGITLYLDSWLPPVGDHPTGFLMADMPVNRLEDLAKKDYLVRLETAERQLQPQNSAQPQ